MTQITVEIWGAGGGGTACSNTGNSFNPFTPTIGRVGRGGQGDKRAHQVPFTGSLICAETGQDGGSSTFDGVVSANGGLAALGGANAGTNGGQGYSGETCYCIIYY